ncbi:hypothetical protein [Roseinatronobacter alkalisoli]|uniref:Uncharacterized protein n=1 Tax=Roseinatronobacter alkalisoli TaxID=3028235 RepID=A0ABT5TFB2_9RHOB|nr:hypothetical protein [Roseinatronobacter sp. HJB301]MDD7973385.1 hypothetical protein [Roseinatronobacter sp. HJB301]
MTLADRANVVIGPNRPVGILHGVRQSGRSGMAQHATAASLIADDHEGYGMR